MAASQPREGPPPRDEAREAAGVTRSRGTLMGTHAQQSCDSGLAPPAPLKAQSSASVAPPVAGLPLRLHPREAQLRCHASRDVGSLPQHLAWKHLSWTLSSLKAGSRLLFLFLG